MIGGIVAFLFFCALTIALGWMTAAYFEKGKEVEELRTKHREKRIDIIKNETGKGFKRQYKLPSDGFAKFFERIERIEEAENVETRYKERKKTNMKALVSRGMDLSNIKRW